MSREEFLKLVQLYVESDPEVAAYVADRVQLGLREALRTANARAVDMEIALSILAARRFKESDAIVLSKLKKWEGQTSINWSWLMEKLEGRSDEKAGG